MDTTIINELLERITALEEEVESLKKAKARSVKKIEYTLPEFVDRMLFEDFLEVRKLKKAANTERALNSIINKLTKFYNDGHDPNLALEESIENSWKGVFEPKRNVIRKSSKNSSVFSDICKEMGVNEPAINAVNPGNVRVLQSASQQDTSQDLFGGFV